MVFMIYAAPLNRLARSTPHRPFGRRRANRPASLVATAGHGATGQATSRRITAQDVKEFLMAYCACFMAVMGLIA